MRDLFRREAAAAPGDRVHGRVFVARPLASGTLVSLLLTAVVIAGGYLACTDYDRRQVVVGRLEPSAGTVWVRAREPGRLAALEVAEGDDVAPGDVLAVVDTDRRRPEGGALAAAMRRAIVEELDGLDAALAAERARRDARQRAIDAQLDSAHETAGLLADRSAVAEQRLRLARQRVKVVRALAARRYASRRDTDAANDQALGLQAQLLDLAQQQALLNGRVRALEAQGRELQDGFRSGYGTYLRERAAIRQRLLQAGAAGQLTVDAPIAGRVSALLVHPGQTIDGATPLLAVDPAGSELVARLYVPSRAAGSLSVGQEVRLLMDAYPHQQFGAVPGRITGIAETTVPPAHVAPGAGIREPVYPVTVELLPALRKPFQPMTLRSGMSLRADLVLERHSLLEWWLRPLENIAERL